MKLPALSTEKVLKIIEKEGLFLTGSKGATISIHPETRQTVVIPVHKKDLPKGTLMEILKQSGIKKEELADL